MVTSTGGATSARAGVSCGAGVSITGGVIVSGVAGVSSVGVAVSSRTWLDKSTNFESSAGITSGWNNVSMVCSTPSPILENSELPILDIKEEREFCWLNDTALLSFTASWILERVVDFATTSLACWVVMLSILIFLAFLGTFNRKLELLREDLGIKTDQRIGWPSATSRLVANTLV